MGVAEIIRKHMEAMIAEIEGEDATEDKAEGEAPEEMPMKKKMGKMSLADMKKKALEVE